MPTPWVVATLCAFPLVLIGMAVGWYLRPLATWCPVCGDRLTCRSCLPCQHRTALQPRTDPKPAGTAGTDEIDGRDERYGIDDRGGTAAAGRLVRSVNERPTRLRTAPQRDPHNA
jgi:hypothetical protein